MFVYISDMHTHPFSTHSLTYTNTNKWQTRGGGLSIERDIDNMRIAQRGRQLSACDLMETTFRCVLMMMAQRRSVFFSNSIISWFGLRGIDDVIGAARRWEFDICFRGLWPRVVVRRKNDAMVLLARFETEAVSVFVFIHAGVCETRKHCIYAIYLFALICLCVCLRAGCVRLDGRCALCKV